MEEDKSRAARYYNAEVEMNNSFLKKSSLNQLRDCSSHNFLSINVVKQNQTIIPVQLHPTRYQHTSHKNYTG